MRNDLISRQAAIDEIINTVSSIGRHDNTAASYGAALRQNEIIDIIEKLPSAQPELVRCKDCKWSDWYTVADGHRYCYCMETATGGRTEDDFCSYAERGTDE